MKKVRDTKLDVLWNGKEIREIQFEGKSNRMDIRTKVQKLSNKLKKDGFNGEINVAINYNGIKPKFDENPWRSGKFMPVGLRVDLYSDTYYEDGDDEVTNENEEEYEAFTIYVKENPEEAGGNSELNDCLYDCLKSCISSKKLPWDHPYKLKKFLDIGRYDKIPTNLLNRIEKKLQMRINVSGEKIRTSTEKYVIEINLELFNGHYSLAFNPELNIKGRTLPEKGKQPKPMIFKITKNIVETYDGKTHKDIAYDKFVKLRQNPQTSGYVLVTKKDSKLTMNEEYDQFIKDAEILSKETKGLINLYDTAEPARTAKVLFNELKNKLIIPEVIQQDEAYFIQMATMAALIHATPYEGKAYKYDVISHYPSSMANKLNLYPIKRGIFTIIKDTDLKLTLPYGIYRCFIEYKQEHTKLFRYNPNNYYTHYDIFVATTLKLEIKMIEDGKPNALQYPRSYLVTGSQYFGNYISYLYPLKEKGIKQVKPILNCLWGALITKKINKIVCTKGDKMGIKGTHLIDTITPGDKKDTTVIKYYDPKCVYETNHARIGPFIISRGRERLFKLIHPYINDIVKIHTDGFIATKELDIKLGSEMGNVRYEGYCENVKIKNNINVAGKFKK